MSARPRDLLKSRALRLGEVLRNIALGIGQADGQTVIDGCDLAVNGTPQQFDIAKGEIAIAGAIATLAASTGNAVSAGATTAAGQFRKVLISRKADGTVVQTVGAVAASQALAVTDDLNQPTDAVAIGWIEIPASFTAGTTALTGGMLKPMLYST